MKYNSWENLDVKYYRKCIGIRLKKFKQFFFFRKTFETLFLFSVGSQIPTSFNPLPPGFFFSSFFGTYPKIGSFRLPTHSRDAHRKFF